MDIEFYNYSTNMRYRNVLDSIEKNKEHDFILHVGEYSIHVNFGGYKDKMLFLKHFLTHSLSTSGKPNILVTLKKGEEIVCKESYSYLDKHGIKNPAVCFDGDNGSEGFKISFFPRDSVELEKFFEEVF